MTTGFGLDPAGYCEGRSVLAVVERLGSKACVTILRNCPFSGVPNEARQIEAILANERKALKVIAALGSIAIDIPIDLQGLPTVCAPTHLWQQTKRNVDKKVGGLEPLASFIGHVTARFQSIFCDSELGQSLGLRVFETYPKPTLKKLLGAQWATARSYKKDESQRAAICRALNIGPQTEIVTHDDLDAVICALTAAASADELWSGPDYESESPDVALEELPRGYRLLSRVSFEEIAVSTADYDRWMRDRSSKIQ
jgi:hypothetical protein